MKFTENQQRAISLRNKNVLVSAGAGSGKTAVLKERVLSKVNDGVSIDQMLILTYTKAAAFEMKTRISNTLKENDKIDELKKIETAQITTFDSYFLNLANKYFLELGLDKNITIVDDILIQTKKKQIIDEIFTDYYKKNDAIFTNFVEDYTIFEDDNLVDNVIELSYEIEKILVKKGDHAFKFAIDIDETFQQFEGLVLEKIVLIRESLQSMQQYALEDSELKFVESYNNKLYPLLVSNEYNNSYEFFQESFRAPSLRSGNNKEKLKSISETIKSELSELSKICTLPKEEFIKNLESTLPYNDLILEIVKELNSRLYNFKKSINCFEFSDITKMCIELLENNLDIRKIESSIYNEIMVDEYQDTNDFQNYFISLISQNNVYMVGDVKQSIYGFRNANPKNFSDLEKEYKKNPQKGEVVNLMDNFRSRDNVLNGINLIFEKVMTEEVGGVIYDDDQKLMYGNKSFEKKDSSQDYDFKVLTYDVETFEDTDLNIHKKYIEPYLVAKDIKEKIDNKHQILDLKLGDLRDCEFKDFAVLTRAKTNFRYYEEMFEHFGLVASSQKEPSFKTHSIVILFQSIIQYLSLDSKNSNRFISKLSIFRSFVSDVTDPEIEDYILNNIKSTSIEEIENKLFEVSINKSSSLKLLFDSIIDVFDIYYHITKLPEVIGSLDRIESISSVCSNFDKFGYDIYQLNEYLQFIDNNENVDVIISSEISSHNAVQIMTIHKSKGLEFPIVYLPELKGIFSKGLTKSDIKFSSKYGIFMPFIESNIKKRQFIDYLALNELKKVDLSESIRILYVALTRAKEQFIFVAPDKFDESVNLAYANTFIKVLSTIGDRFLVQRKKESFLDIKFLEEFQNNKYNNSDQKDKVLLEPKNKYLSIDIKPTLKVTNKASHDIEQVLSEEVIGNIKLGNKIHEILEYIDFSNIKLTGDTLVDKIIKNMSNYDIFINNKGHYSEFEFYFEDTHGFIDCLLEFEDHYLIVDYKLKNIDNEAYIKQLKVYKTYIEKITKKVVHTALYSLIDDELKYIHK